MFLPELSFLLVLRLSILPCSPLPLLTLLFVLLSLISMSALSPDMAAFCEGHLSSVECFTAPQGMDRCKTPGLDSLPMEFYLKFWLILGSNLVDVRNSCFDSCCLSLSQRRVVI